MRGVPSSVTSIRKKVFTEVARMAYDGDYGRMEELPYRIVPGTEARYRESIFLERAIAGERVRLAMGLPLRPVDEHTVRIEQEDGEVIVLQNDLLPDNVSPRPVHVRSVHQKIRYFHELHCLSPPFRFLPADTDVTAC